MGDSSSLPGAVAAAVGAAPVLVGVASSSSSSSSSSSNGQGEAGVDFGGGEVGLEEFDHLADGQGVERLVVAFGGLGWVGEWLRRQIVS